MITLAKHIELLLLHHDCVIVPGLGGFIANHAEARYTDEDEHLFLPPYRTIGFNQQLQVNDGLLVQSYMAAYDTSYPSAHLQMEQDLEKMMRILDLTGKYELENIGTLQKDLHQNISLTAMEPGALTPSLYGLYSYEMKSLRQVIKEKEIERNLQATAAAMQITSATTASSEPRRRKRDRAKPIVIRLSRHWLDVSIAAAAAVVLFFCISYPAMKNSPSESDTVVAAFTPMQKVNRPSHSATKVSATKVTQNLAPAERPEAIEATTASVATEKKAEAEKSADSNVQKSQVADSKKAEPQTLSKGAKYAIVLASYVSQKNAENFIKQLNEGGYKNARFVENGKMNRILYAGYATEADAQAALNTLRQESSFFADGWILEL